MSERIDPEHQEEVHVVKPKMYLIIFLSLLALTALTTGVSFIDLGWANVFIALLIAVCKASLVVLFFMHIHYSSRILKMTVSAGLFALFVLLIMTMTDYISRAWGRF